MLTPSGTKLTVLLYEPNSSHALYMKDALALQNVEARVYCGREAFVHASMNYKDAACIIGGTYESPDVLDALLRANIQPQRILYNATSYDFVTLTREDNRKIFRGVRVGNNRVPHRTTIEDLVAHAILRAA